MRVRSLPLRDQAGTIVGAAEIFAPDRDAPEAARRIAELEELAYLDALTALPNRRYLQSQLEQRLGELQRYGWPFGAVLLDVDHFKNVNDVFGHPTGDRVLTMVAKTLELATRPFDLVGRWGGEEFLAVVTNIDLESLTAVADRFRALVRTSSLTDTPSPISVTVSAGATLANLEDDPESILQRVDRLLYRSKEEGRDRTSVEQPG
ncbi:MAG TPA: GGDEF domain-containing protein [Thermoleophilia bacterium]|nr:GGDEF domain-containing protein [Thermoleophilia bacterium]